VRNENSANDYPSSVRLYCPTSSALNTVLWQVTQWRSSAQKMVALQTIQWISLLFSLHPMNSKKDKFSQPDGFRDWQAVGRKIQKHENSKMHRDCILNAHTMCCAKAQIDEGLEHQAEEKKQYWVNALWRVVAVIKFLATRGWHSEETMSFWVLHTMVIV